MASIALPVIGWFVTPIITKVLGHGILHFKEKWRLEEGVSEEIDRLSKVLRLIKGVLEDAEQKQTENSGVLSWLGELKDVLYDAEDILDRYEVDLALMNKRDAEQLPSEMGSKAKVSGQFFSSFSSRQESSLDLSVAYQIKSIREKLEDLRRQGHEWGLRSIATPSGEQGSTNRLRRGRETTSFLADEVIGRADEKRDIINMLLGDNKNLSVLPIIGMGGVGKTALARLVYKEVQDFFESKAWVCIGMSQDLDLKRLLIEIINSICSDEKINKDYSGCNLDLLGKIIVEEIKDKQPFILVLDDAWDTKVNHWKMFLEPLKANNLTCRIIVTTRDQKVVDAIRINKLEPIPLNFLKEDDMWNIFRRHAFGDETTDADPELESIGRQIVQRLKGLPLAAEIIGDLLYGNTEATDWRRILKNKVLEIKEDENYMLSILMLSYDSLSAVLKQSFLYFSLFPKDYTFVFEKTPRTYLYGKAHVKQIFSIWMSQKLTSTDDESAPDTGSGIIIQFSNRSLLQSIETEFGPSVTIHDLVHDLAEKIAKEEILCVSGVTEHNLPNKLRHISFFDNDSDVNQIAQMLPEIRKCKTLRTLLLYTFNKKVNDYTGLLDSCFNSLIYIRALSLHNKYMTSLPESIGNLKLLRYLDINLPRMEKLSDSVSSLDNLQVLVVLTCVNLTLNDSLTRLVNLVNLDFGGDWVPLKNIGKLTNLQHLKEFRVRRHDGHKVMELQKLNKIRGSLHISNLENIEAKEEAHRAQLDKKDGLKELKFSWGHRSGLDGDMHLDVLEGLRPSRNLNKLSLDGYTGTRLATWFNREDLPFLKAIELYRCLNLKVLPPLTDCLNELIICSSPRLVEILSLPPKLQHLRLMYAGVTSLFRSSSASQSLPSMPCLASLRILNVVNCPNLDGSLSALLKGSLPSLNSLYITEYRHPLEAFCYLTALSDLRLSSCSGKIAIDVRALVSLKDLRIHDCPSAVLEDPHPNSIPCTSLCRLKISRSPSLLKSLSQSKYSLSSLECLDIDGNDLDDSVLSGCLMGLSSLQSLFMKNCPNITSIPEEVLGTLASLETLTISSCGRLKHLNILALSSLQSLYIRSCPRFLFDCRPIRTVVWPLRDVEAIDISADQIDMLFPLLVECSNVKSIKLTSNVGSFVFKRKDVTSGLGWLFLLTRLEDLSVSSCEGFSSEFPSLNLLKDLSIRRCSDVTYFRAPLDSLRSLSIEDCPNFTFFELPSVPFPSLVYLSLGGFNVQQLTHLIMRVTSSPLKELDIEGCDDLISFEGELEVPFLSLTSLRHLRIHRCARLQRLPLDLGGSESLRSLTVKSCPLMSLLPEERLPASLECIDISGCPALEARYGKIDGNPHRQRISHIPFIVIE